MTTKQTALDHFDEIVRAGNAFNAKDRPSNWIVCADGFKVSVLAHAGAYCTPRPPIHHLTVKDAPPCGPFTAVEVGFPSARPEPWSDWEERAEAPEDPIGSVYGFVPVALVRALIESHEVR